MDYFDLFYHYGVFGFFFFFLPFWKHFSWRGKIEKKISIFLVFLLAFFSGHILLSPSVSMVSGFLFCLEGEKKK